MKLLNPASEYISQVYVDMVKKKQPIYVVFCGETWMYEVVQYGTFKRLANAICTNLNWYNL